MSFLKSTISSKMTVFATLLLTIPMGTVLAESAGDLNTSFGTSGITTVNIGEMSAEDSAHNAVVDSTGKTIVVGESNNDIAIARFTRAGALDTTFGTNGMVTTDIADNEDVAKAVAIDASGNIVVAGYFEDGDSTDMLILRYDSTGNLDTTFGGGDGYVTTDVGGNDESFAYAIDIDASGNIVIAGATGFITAYDFAVVRLNSAGVLDTTFGGGDGYVTTDIGTMSDEAWAVDTDSSGRVVVAGHAESTSGTNYDFALARYTSTGTLDTVFGGGDGIVTTDMGGNDAIRALKRSSTAILALGQSGSSSSYTLGLAKYTSAGALDTTFGGGDGMVVTAGLSAERVQSYAFNGTVGAIAVGYEDGSVNRDFHVSAFDLSGNAFTRFSTDGVALVDFTASSTDAASAMTRDGDGNLLVAGFTYNGADFAMALLRLTSAGILDTTFGDGDGIVTLDFSGSTYVDAKDVVVDSSGRILVAGYGDMTGDDDFILARFTSAGVLDTTFGGGAGYVTTDFASADDKAYAVVVDASDRIVVGGQADSVTSSYNDFAIARFDSNGNLDTTFGGDGKVTLNISDYSNSDAVYDLAIDDSGNILAGGTATNSATSVDYALAKFDASGNLDTTFGGGDGYLTYEFSGARQQDYAFALTLDDLSHVLLAGTAYDSSGQRNAVAIRFDSSGNLDTTFGGGDGYATVDIESTGNYSSVQDLVIDDTGRIFVVGYLSDTTSGYSQMAALRFDSSGNLDATFGDAGTQLVTGDGLSRSYGYAALLDDNGYIIIAGKGDNDFMITSLVN